MIGSSVRSLYVKGKGFPCFVSVEQDGTGSGLPTALALSRAIGATKAGAIASSAREETAMDLFAGSLVFTYDPCAPELTNIRTGSLAQYHHALQVRIPITIGWWCGDAQQHMNREAFSVLKEAGCSDEALCYEM